MRRLVAAPRTLFAMFADLTYRTIYVILDLSVGEMNRRNHIHSLTGEHMKQDALDLLKQARIAFYASTNGRREWSLRDKMTSDMIDDAITALEGNFCFRNRNDEVLSDSVLDAHYNTRIEQVGYIMA
jgi:hypothetical protein